LRVIADLAMLISFANFKEWLDCIGLVRVTCVSFNCAYLVWVKVAAAKTENAQKKLKRILSMQSSSLKVVSGEKEGGTKVYSIDSYNCRTVALSIFFPSGFSPHLVVDKFPFPVTPAQSVGTLMRKVGMEVKTVLSAVSYS